MSDEGSKSRAAIDEAIVGTERARDYEISRVDRFRYRTRYFIDSGVIGSREFVDSIYQQFRHLFASKHPKRPKTIKGLDGIYSMKRLSEG